MSRIECSCIHQVWKEGNTAPKYFAFSPDKNRNHLWKSLSVSEPFERKKTLPGNVALKCALTGRHSGLVTSIQRVLRVVKRLNFALHREALTVQKMASKVKDILEATMKSVNFTEAIRMNVRLFCVRSKIHGYGSYTGSFSYRSKMTLTMWTLFELRTKV
jgi:hypothetical protein